MRTSINDVIKKMTNSQQHVNMKKANMSVYYFNLNIWGGGFNAIEKIISGAVLQLLHPSFFICIQER